MAGLISGVFNNVGGSSAKTDRGNFLKGIGDMSSVYNWALPFGEGQAKTGQAITAAGVGNLADAGNYYRKLASGDRPTALEAVAPQTNAAIAQSDAEKRQLSEMGTARGGGAVGVNQQRDTDLMGKIDNMLFGARGAGAAGEAGVGQAEAGIGLGETGQGLQGAGLAERAGEGITGESRLSRTDSEQIHQQHVQQLSKAFEDLLSGFVPGEGSGAQDFLSKIPGIKGLI